MRQLSKGLVPAIGLAVAGACLVPTPARADAIDGDWCNGSLHFVIDGPSIVTPGRNKIQGRYGRYNFAYVVPANRIPPKICMPKAKAAALRALEIDDSLAEAHTSLGRVLQVYEWNWAEAEKQFKRAIELNPRYPVAHQWYGGYFERVGQLDQAIAERKISLELDPLSAITNSELGQSYLFARQYDNAIEQFRKTLELEPNFPTAQQYIPIAYALRGMHDEAIASIQSTPENMTLNETGSAGYVYALTGRRKEVQCRC